MSTDTAIAGPADQTDANRSRRIFLGIIIVATLAFPLLQVFFGGFSYWLHMALFLYMNIAIASTWNIIGGFAGYISLGHNVFFAIGGYSAAILFAYFGVSPFIAFPLCGLISMGFGFIIGMMTLRTRGPTFIISTIALVLLAKILLDNWDYIGGSNGISLPLLDMPVEYVKLPFYYAMLAIAAGSVFLGYSVRRWKFGLGLRAISSGERHCRGFGVSRL